MKRLMTVCAVCAWSVVLLSGGGCGGDGDAGGGGQAGPDPRPEETGALCESAVECFTDVAEGDLQGEAMCLDRVRGGYCTHTCEQDEDCCAAEGECKTDLDQVCSPFESTGIKMCFLSCETRDYEAAGAEDDAEYCQRWASADFICRSSGGGSENRKICVPGDCGLGARCAGNDDCTGDWECLTGFAGGYCSRAGCASDDDCNPSGNAARTARCVEQGDGTTYCAKTCTRASDCGFCRGESWPTSCRDDVSFVDDGTAAVCVPD